MCHREIDSFVLTRNKMVRDLKDRYGIYSRNLLDIMEKTPRHLFISEALRYRAYKDTSLPIGFNQTISKPSTIARMVQSLNLTGDEMVLEIGTGSGYQSAIIAQLVNHLTTTERIKELHQRARELLLFNLGFNNIKMIHEENFLGIDDLFDAIIISAGAGSLPVQLFDKLVDNGVLVTPVEKHGEHRIMRYIKKSDNRIIEDDLGQAIFVPLVYEKT
ncbi:MAG: protein-L-isoaspartate(D-aspartate) O-methyltransferase [Spirochaetota bacterium]|nr:protein-L-isoaspartate(D-aspartate) O-methyltransferase [Spirochaetota bacterium]